VERPNLGPVEGHQQRLLSLPREPTNDPGHGVADVNPVVIAEPPAALDAALGGGLAAEAPADGREGGASDVCSRFDQVGQGFGSALAQLVGYCKNPADDRIG
jgi:hypothetical protein